MFLLFAGQCKSTADQWKLLYRKCLHVRNPMAKTEYFPLGTRQLKIDISHREADCFLLIYPTQTPSVVPASHL